MTGIDWPSFLIQLPIVAAFVWYSLELQRRYSELMDKRDKGYLDALAKISNSIDCHDDKSRERSEKAAEKAEALIERAAETAAQKVVADAVIVAQTKPRPRAR